MARTVVAIAALLIGDLAAAWHRHRRDQHTCLVTYAATPPACVTCGRTM